MRILSVCSGQSNAYIQNQDFGYTLAIVLLLQCLFSVSNLAQSREICSQVVWQHSTAEIAVRDKENRVFYLNLVYELYNDNKPCPCMHEPPLGEPESKKICFATPIFASSEISKTINMLSKHGTTNVIIIIR